MPLRALLAAALLCASLCGCALGIPVPVWTAGLGACAAACGPVVALEKDAFDYATGQTKPASPVTPTK